MSYLSLNSKSIVPAKLLATAGILATVMQTLPAQAATLDWGTLKSSTPFAGTISQSNTISVSGGGSVNLELGTIADINNVTRTLGTGSQFVSGTPKIDPLLNGTLPDESPSLYLQMDSSGLSS